MSKRYYLRPRCNECGELFEKGEEMFSWPMDKGDVFVCAGCFDGLLFSLTLHERAKMVGSEIRTPPS